MTMDQITYSTPLARSTMAYVLAGGRGSRLMELTDNRAKPAVYFGGKTRIIDFALSNALNSGIRRIAVATQYKAHSLIRHLQRGWNFLQPMRNESFDILPASQRVAENQWYMGTADAVFQNIDIIDGYAPEYIVVLAGDHVYKMDYERMLVQHVNDDADVTVGCIEVSVEEASGFGVMHVDATDRIVGFVREARRTRRNCPDRPGRVLASMGIYVFRRQFLIDQLRRDAADPHSSRDFGRDIIPYLVQARQGRRAPVRAIVRALAGRARDVLARRGDARRVLRRQHRPDRRRAGARRLRRGLADLDLRENHAAREIRSRRRGPARHGHLVARVRRLHHLRARGCAIRCCASNVHVHSFGEVDHGVILPYVDIGRRAQLTQRHRRLRRADSRPVSSSATIRSSMPRAFDAPSAASASSRSRCSTGWAMPELR